MNCVSIVVAAIIGIVDFVLGRRFEKDMAHLNYEVPMHFDRMYIRELERAVRDLRSSLEKFKVEEQVSEKQELSDE